MAVSRWWDVRTVGLRFWAVGFIWAAGFVGLG